MLTSKLTTSCSSHPASPTGGTLSTGRELPPAARKRLGIRPGQKNVLLRVALRDLHHTLTDHEANLLRDRIYRTLHKGSNQQLAVPPDGPS